MQSLTLLSNADMASGPFFPLDSMLRPHKRLCQVIWYLFKGILMLLPQFLLPFALTKDVDCPNLFPTQSSPLHLFFFKSIYLKHTKNIFLFFPSLVSQRSRNFCAVTQFKLSRASTQLSSERKKSLVIQQYHAKTLKNSNLHSVAHLTQTKLYIAVESISCFYGP